MGIFSKDKDPEKAAEQQARKETREQEKAARQAAEQAKATERAQRTFDKARAKAQKKRVDVEGAVAVGHTYEDSADQFLVIFPDRVEHVRMGKTGSFLGAGAGTESIPISRISSTEAHTKGIYCIVEVHTSGNSIKFKTDVMTGPRLRQEIITLMQSPAPSTPAASMPPSPAPSTPAAAEPDPADQIRKLADLHAAGILSDDEFATKKAELLSRM